MKKYLLSFVCLILFAAFTVSTTVAQCTCGLMPTTNNWTVFTVRSPLPVRTVRCGQQFRICVRDSMALQGKFNCAGGCNAFYKTSLKRDGVVMEEATYGRPEILYTRRFRIPGNYVLTIIPFCSNNLCLSCTFYITVVGC